jgi:hypothetical protein
MAGVPAAPDPNVSEVNRIYSLPAGKGDIQLSWQIIDFHATLARPAPILPTQAVFINQVNNIFALCAPQNYTADARYARVTTYKRNVMQNRAETVIRKIREAIFVIADMAPDNTEPQYFDRNHIFTVTANSRVMHPPAWAEIDAPLGLAAFNAYLAALPNPRPNAPLRYVAPSRAELIAQRQRRLAAIAEEIADSPARIENVDHGLGLVPVPIPAVIDTTAGDGNCFWYAVRYVFHSSSKYSAQN